MVFDWFVGWLVDRLVVWLDGWLIGWAWFASERLPSSQELQSHSLYIEKQHENFMVYLGADSLWYLGET